MSHFNITSILVITLGVYGAVLIIAKDTAIPQQFKSNSTVQTIYDNNIIVGVVCVLVAYYFYTTLSQEQLHEEMDSSIMTTETPEIPLPSNEGTTSHEL